MSSHSRHPTSISTTVQGQHKVAIPRLQNPAHLHTTMKDRRRVPRACTACRSHKIKCTGERLQCQHCALANLKCVYIMPRKDRLKIITERCHQMAGLLKGLRSLANAEDDAKILEIIDEVEQEQSHMKPNPTPPNPDTNAHHYPQDDKGTRGMAKDSEIDIGPLDILDEDLHNEPARTTGFVGRNSELQWLRTVAIAQTEPRDHDDNEYLHRHKDSFVPSIESVSAFSYWSDNERVDLDPYMDMYELPQVETAERLLQHYMLKAHDSFPILPRKLFEGQFRMYYSAVRTGKAPALDSKWQSILNLVFAIGARYMDLNKAIWRGDECNHRVYQGRARALGLNETSMSSHSDVPQIQVLGLLAFYWLSTGQIGRAWTITGIALRSAYSLGLHVRNEDPSASASKKEMLVRIWWSLYSLEQMLSTTTGRPSTIVDSNCSVPLPIPISEGSLTENIEMTYKQYKGSGPHDTTRSNFSSIPNVAFGSSIPPVVNTTLDTNSGSFFRAITQLSIITKSIITSIYSVDTMMKSPDEMRQEVSRLEERLVQSVLSLPGTFKFHGSTDISATTFARERMILAFQYSSAKILLSRPYLADRKPPSIDTIDSTFARRMANECIEAAQTTINLLSDEPQPSLIYDQGPWWCIINHLMQAISVLLLGLSFPESTSQDSLSLMQSTRKAIRWLKAMEDSVSERAYHIALRCFQRVARRYSMDVSDLWTTPTPPNMMPTYDELQHRGMSLGVSRYLPVNLHTARHGFAAYDPMAAAAVAADPVDASAGLPIVNANFYMVPSTAVVPDLANY